MPQQSPAARKARFIAAEAAQSTLELAEGGQLPELHVHDTGERKKKQADRSQSSSMNSLVLLGAIGLSLVLSVFLVLLDSNSQTSSDQSAKIHARAEIENNFFGEMDDNAPLKPYQEYLREAKRAHIRNDRKTERRMYMNVLESLREERWGEQQKWLTGSRSRDETLEKQLTILLSDS